MEEPKVNSELLERRVSFKDGLGLVERLEETVKEPEASVPELITSSTKLEEMPKTLEKIVEGRGERDGWEGRREGGRDGWEGRRGGGREGWMEGREGGGGREEGGR